MSDEIRAFIAVEIDPEVRERTRLLMEDLRKGVQFTGAHPSWVKPDNLHFTLFFLGKTAPPKIVKIKAALDALGNSTAAFDLQIAGLGVFPNPRRPRVLWIGVDRGKKEIVQLQTQVVKRLLPLGYEPDRKPYHPHLTLARIKAMKGVSGMMDVVHAHKDAECGQCRISRIVLFRSDLHPTGAKYTPLHEVAF